MDKPISREDALKALDEMSYKSPHESATSVVRKKHFGEILEKFIMQQPSAQKKGKWLEKERIEENLKWADGLQSAKCSVCGRYHTTPYMYSFTDYNFCPHCGADMREEEE